MKKAIFLLLAMLIVCSVFLTGCGSSSANDLSEVSSYMQDDNTVIVKFRNETNKTITYVDGTINLFTGSATNQNAIKTPDFTWTGTCAKGSTFTVTVKVSNAPAGLADEVNRIGFHIWEIS